MRLALPSPYSFVKLQAVCIGVAAIITAFFWANGDRINLNTVLIYSLVIGNLTFPSMRALGFLYKNRRFPFNWIVYSLSAAIVALVVYFVAAAAVWWFAPPSPQSLFQLIITGWKFPVFATLAFSVLTHVFRITRERLEQRNRELQKSVETGAAQLQVQEQELERAREIQQSLLPKQIPQLKGFEVAGAWQPARAVSGDYYDVFKLDAHRLGICIADVVGKGVSAALLMANVQAAVRAYANGAESPATLCTKVNLLLCENIATGKYVTFLYAVLDSEARTLTYCNAGHLNPALISQGEARSLDGSGAVLGVFPEWVYHDVAVGLAAGDRVLLFTDGITEALGLNDEELGERPLAECARDHCGLSAPEMNSLLLETVTNYCDGHFFDDATLLVIAAD